MPPTCPRRLLPSLALALALAGCASGVRLDAPEPSVEQRQPRPVEGAASAPLVAPPATASAASAPGSVSGSALPGAASQVAPVLAPPSATDPAAADAAEADRLGRIVYFEYDRDRLRDEDQALVEAHARLLVRNPARRVQVEGHTDDRGSSEYNLALGQRRAESVVRAMRLLGVGSEQAEATSYGKERPAASGEGEAVWAKNRRAEIRER